MTDVYHLIISEHEKTILNKAATTLLYLRSLAHTLGIQAEELNEQAQLLSAIEIRLRWPHQVAITLTPEPEPTPEQATA